MDSKASHSEIKHHFETVSTAKAVQAKIMTHLKNLSADGKNVLILLDVDDVLIVPESLTFHSSPYNKLIDELKAQKDRYPDFEGILSRWRLQRKAMLVDQDWPKVIEELKQSYSVYGLTKVHTGHFGHIESMETWRYEELSSLGLEFTAHPDRSVSEQNNQPVFYHGIMMTGAASKEETLAHFADSLGDIDTIIFVDDRQKNLAEIESYCQKNGISFLGVHFDGLRLLPGQQREEIYAIQKETLFKEQKWLSDSEAKNKLDSESSN